MEPAKKTTTRKTPAGKPIELAPGMEQVLVEKSTPFAEILAADKAEKHLIFDMLDFPELSRVNLGKLSQRARMAYQQDYRNAMSVTANKEHGFEPFEDRIKAIGANDPLSRGHESLRKGKAKKLPKGMKHLNVMPEEVEELEAVGYKKAKAEEVDIVGSREKAGAVVLMNNKGKVDNVTMLVDDEDYQKHRKADRAKSAARLESNIETTKENMKKFDSRVTIFDTGELSKK